MLAPLGIPPPSMSSSDVIADDGFAGLGIFATVFRSFSISESDVSSDVSSPSPSASSLASCACSSSSFISSRFISSSRFDPTLAIVLLISLVSAFVVAGSAALVGLSMSGMDGFALTITADADEG